MKKILLLLGFVLFIWQSNAQSYCTTGVGPTITADTNVESVDLIGETTSIAYTGCPGVVGVEDQTAQVADLIAGNTYTIDIQFGTCGGDFTWAAEAWIDYNLGFSFQASESIGTATGNGDTGPLTSFTFTVPTDAINGNSRLRIIQEEGGAAPLDPCASFFYGSVTDFTISISGGVDITCQVPFNVATANPSADTLDVTWDAEPNASNGYIWEVYNLGDDPASATAVVSGTFPAGTTSGQATGLPSSSDLELYLASDCGTDGISDLNGPFSFATACTTVGVPFNEDFSSLALPNCWNQGVNNNESWLFTDTPPPFGHIGNNGVVSSTTASGGGFAWVDDSAAHSQDTRLESPFIDVSSLNVPYLTFWLISNNEDSTNVDFSVEVWDGAAWNQVFFSNQNTVDGEWQEIEVELSALTFTGPAQLAFVVDENNGTDFDDDVAIDDVTLDEAPTCPKPSNVTIVDVFADSLEISWNPVANASAGYIWEIYNQGDDPAVDPVVSSGTFPAGSTQGIADGLMPEMDYDIYLASDCGATDGQSVFALPVSFTTTVLCSLPSTFDVSNLLPDSATLNWSTIPNAAGGYQWAVFNAGDDPTVDPPLSSGTAASTDNSVDLTGLTPNTQYEAYITTDCAADGQSVQSPALAFATPCTVFAAPFFDDFEGASWVPGTGFGNTGDAIDPCWSRNPTEPDYFWGTRTGATGSGATGPSAANSGANYVFTESSNGATGDEALLVTPLIDMSSLTDPALSFYYHMFGATIGTLSVDVNPGTGYDLDVFTISGDQGDAWVEQFVDLNAYLGQTIQVRFRGVRGTSFTSDMAIDDVRVDDAPTCLTPAPVTVSNITVDSADFSWADISNASNGYNWELYLAGADPATDPVEQSGNAPAGTTTVTITGLTDGTDYDFYITSDCGAVDGLSLTVGPIAFQTLFLPPANDNICDAIPLPICLIPEGDAYTNFASTAEPNEPVGSCFNGGINGSVWFTFVAPASGEVQVSTDIAGATLVDTEVAVYEAPTDCTDASTMGPEIGCDQDGGVVVGFNSIVDLTGLTPGDTYYVQVDRWGTAADGEFGISVVDTNPSCAPPGNLAFTSSTTTTADFSWDDVAGATNGYNWYVFNPGENINNATPLATGSVAAGVLTATATGLAPSSTYDLYVESDCGGSIDLCAFSGPVTFATQCTVFPTPYTEDFDGASWVSGAGFNNAGDAIDNCWSRNPDNGFFWGTRTGATGSAGTGPSAANSAANYMFTESSAGALDDEAFLDSPLLDLSNLNAPALFFWYHLNGGDMGTLTVDVITSTGVDLDIFSVSGPQQTADTDPWVEQIIDLAAYSGQTVQIRFRGIRGDGFTSDMAIDDVKVDEAPTCLKPVNLTAIDVFFNGLEISWGPVGNATSGYIWEVYNAGDDPASTTPVATGTFPAGSTQGVVSDPAILPLTAYDVYIISDCGPVDGQSDLAGPVGFTTTELCSLPTTFTVDNVLPNQAELNWSSIPNATGYNWAIFFAGDDPTSAPPQFSGTAPSTDNSVIVTGLTDNTAYDAYVTTDCGADGLSFLSAPVPFITPCLAFPAPFNEDFDGPTWVAGTGFNNANDAIDNCWSRDPGAGFFWGTRTGGTGSGGTGPDGAFNGANYVFVEGSGAGPAGTEATLTTPFIDVSTVTTPALSFWYHMFGADMGTLAIDINDGTGFVLDVFTIVGEQQTDETDDWIFQIVDLSAYVGQTIQVRFRGVKAGGFTTDMAIDEVEVDEAPTCFDPLNLATLSVTDVTANLTWTAGAGETIFDVEIVPAGATPTGIPTFEDVTLPFTADGLLPETDYDFYVRADCGAGDVSDWVGPSSFTTTFSPITVIVNAPPINQTYCYDNNEFKEWLFTSSDGVTPVEITFNTGTIEDGTGSQDRLRVFDGFDVNAPVLYDSDVDGTDLAGVTLVATSGTAYMLLVSDIFGSCQGGVDVELPFDFDVFAGNPLAGPMQPAPDPTEDPVNVISLFSGVYTNVPVDTFLTPWSSGLLSDIQIQGNDTKFYSDLDFAGIETVVSPVDASDMDFFHIDVWSPNATTFRVKLVNDLGGANQSEGEIAFNIAQGQWESLQIPLTEFADPTVVTDPNNVLNGTEAIAQYIISGLPAGSLVIYADNIYFSKTAIGTDDFVFDNFTFYPSPAKENLYLESTLEVEQVKVFNMLGQEVIRETPGELTPTINVGALQTGTYIMNVTIDGVDKNFRFIKE